MAPHGRTVNVRELAILVALVPVASTSAQPVEASWIGTTDGGWTQVTRWTTNPYYPNNNTPPGTQYNATIHAGTGFFHIQLIDPISLNHLAILDPNVTIDHSAGTLTLDSGMDILAGQYRLTGATIVGGTINIAASAMPLYTAYNPGGTVPPRLQGVTVNGNMLASELRIRDGLTLNGTVSDGVFVIENSGTLTGGSLVYPNSGFDHGIFNQDGVILTLSPTTTISGGDSRGVRLGGPLDTQQPVNSGIVNKGRISANIAAGIEIWSTTFANQGTLEATNGGIIDIGMTGGFASNVAGVFGTAWTNNGRIHLAGDSQHLSTINLGGQTTTTGLGSIERTGGTINLYGSIDNTGAVLNLSPSAWSLTMRSGSITGGVINIARNGGFGVSLIGLAGATLDGVRINGGFSYTAGQPLIIKNGLNLNGQLTIPGAFQTLEFDGTQTLNGGLVLAIPSSSGASIIVSANSALTLSPSTVIQANSFTFGGYPGAAVVNQGTIASTGFAGISVPTGPLRFRNDGIVDATAGNIKLGLSTSIDNVNQNTLTGGVWRVGPGPGQPALSISFVSDSPVLTTNAADVTISGSGSFPALEGLSVNQGTFRLRQGHDESCPSGLINTGQLDLGAGCDVNITSQFTQGDQGTLTLALAGTTQFTQYAAVHASASAALAGTLFVQLASAFIPSLGDQFDIITAPSVNGSFAAVQLPVISGTRQFQLSYLPDRVRLTVIPANCYANCDESAVQPFLNANDFQCFLNAFAAGNPYANCDGSTTDPVLNANDFSCFLNAFAAGCP